MRSAVSTATPRGIMSAAIAVAACRASRLAWTVGVLAAGISACARPAAAAHPCDPVTDAGWSLVADEETLSETDGPPYPSGPDWFVDRVTTVLPYCHYFNSIGIYSMRSYSLDPVVTTRRVAICTRGARDGAMTAVAPYAGPCPPLHR